ncbi:ThuA domain-containing protein [Streptomyces sp. NRRL B-2790]|uniref:ThuA domain-containing protein n=1 Tax=Streptomyces sp. NRRL B-2790 TaxID=1463835 RepID=UPI0035643CE1
MEVPHHPATRHLPAVRDFTDEWYDFRSNPRGRVRVLLRADERSYAGGGRREPAIRRPVPPDGGRTGVLHGPGTRRRGLSRSGLSGPPERQDRLGGRAPE